LKISFGGKNELSDKNEIVQHRYLNLDAGGLFILTHRNGTDTDSSYNESI